MSWEIFASAYEGGQAAEFDTADLRAVFARGSLPHPEWPPSRTDFLYDDGHILLHIDDYPPKESTFVVYKIFGRTACARLLHAATLFHCLIYWPGVDIFAAISHEDTLAHLPDVVIQSACPVITPEVDAFIEAVGFSSKMTKEDWATADEQYRAWYEKHDPERRL